MVFWPHPPLDKKRYHDLDAVRGFAMLLGIVLHGGMFIREAGWDIIFPVIHGFRMQLFFLVSGFFTVMLWRSRGVKELLQHRAKRLLLPIVVLLPFILPLMMMAGIVAALGEVGLRAVPATIANRIYQAGENISSAAKAGDTKSIKKHLAEGADVNGRDPLDGTPLHWAAIQGHTNALKLLIEKGADVNATDLTGQPPLFWATFNGQYQAVELLIKNGADVNPEINIGGKRATALQISRDKNVEAVEFIAKVHGIKSRKKEEILEGRRKVTDLITQHTSKGKSKGTGKSKPAKAPPVQKPPPVPRPLENFSYRVYSGQWENLPDFEKLEPKRKGESPSGIIGLGPARGMKAFAMEFKGQLEIEEDGNYTFTLGSDDGSRLFVNDEEIIDNDGTHGMEYREGTVTLKRGNATIDVTYFERGGANGLSLSVSGPGMDNVYLTKYVRPGGIKGAVIAEMPGWAQARYNRWRDDANGGQLAHLWFLGYLFWLVAGFAVVAWGLDKLAVLREERDRVSTSSWLWLALVPIVLALLVLPVDDYGNSVSDLVAGLPWLTFWAALIAWVVLWLVRKIKIKQVPLWRRIRLIPKIVLLLKRIAKKIHAPWRKLGLGYFIWLTLVVTMMWWALPWLVVAFGVGVWLVVKLDIKQWPAWITASPWRWLWLGLITLILQVIMFWGEFGPDTTLGIIPWNLLLLYYGVFFGFGALCYGQKDFEEKGGRYWIVCLVLAIPALLLGLYLLEARNAAGAEYENNRLETWLYHVGSSLFQVLYAWLMIFGCIGLFRHFFSEGKKWVRYLSDSSYWLYIGHIAALGFTAGLASLLDVPNFLKLIISLILATVILLLTYHAYVRYTWIGTMLNGKRTREEELPPSGKKRWVVLLLFVFTWFAGFHRFYAGRYIAGILLPLVLILAVMGVKMGYPMVLTVAFWGLLLWAIHDFLSIVTGTYVDGEGKRIYNWR